jgi:hypothetical protein
MKKESYVYVHKRLDTNIIFYVGIGTGQKFKRAFYQKDRTDWWKKIVGKAGYSVEIILNNVTRKEACEKEVELISFYGRRDLGLGSLVNLTNGGEYNIGRKKTIEERKKISNALKGKPLHPNTIAAKNVANSGSNCKFAKTVIDIVTGIEYGTVREAAKQLNLCEHTLIRWLKGIFPNKSNLMYKNNEVYNPTILGS